MSACVTQVSGPAEAHARRVAAVAVELGRVVGLSEAELTALEKAASLCRSHPDLLQGAALSRLLADAVGVPGPAFDGPPVSLEPSVLEILQALYTGASGPAAKTAELIQIAESLDSCLEWEPFRSQDDEADPAECLWEAPTISAGFARLRAASVEDLRRIAMELPAFPESSRKALTALVREEVAAHEIGAIAESDPSFSGRLVAAANTALLSPRVEIRTVNQAVNYLGCMAARKVLIAVAMSDIFAPPAMRPLRRHSLEAADLAAQIAALTEGVAPAEAFLAGLLHDVGALAISCIDATALARRDRLSNDGCPQMYAEQLVCGFDHAKAGAVVLGAWQFPQDFITAVQYHHSPERTDSRLAALLYATEFWACSEEDLPSTLRLHAAFDRLGISPALLQKHKVRPSRVVLGALAPV